MANTYNINQQNTNLTQSIPISNGAIGTTVANTSWSNSAVVPNAIITIPEGGQKVMIDEKAALEVKGRIIHNGEDLNERLERIETLLQIPTRDVTMENKHPKLKKLWEEYNRELSKYRTWDAIKGDK